MPRTLIWSRYWGLAGTDINLIILLVIIITNCTIREPLVPTPSMRHLYDHYHVGLVEDRA